MIKQALEKVLAGELLQKEELLALADESVDLAELTAAADQIRQAFCGNRFDICTIINGKSGRCPENCKYCAQSAHYATGAQEYPLLDAEVIYQNAMHCQAQGIKRYSVVTSGKRLTDAEVDSLCEVLTRIHQDSDLLLCTSNGLLRQDQFLKLKQAGVTRYHNNLETSRRYFPSVCTTHSYDDKIAVLKAAQQAGLAICSGGIMGLGETMEDRIDMALELRGLGVHSIPINVLNPIPGTPFGNNTPLTEDEVLRIVAVYRFALPNAAIRMAGGRGLLPDKGAQVFQSGANAAITGDMLTTSGITVADDQKIIRDLGFEIQPIE